ncbi:MAG: multi-sensor hybrid histidine kinase [Deltaproteobacteria bacterium]|nr:multi-sensor hybrid histidine kinase [Deltaproteobacteria bacterium]
MTRKNVPGPTSDLHLQNLQLQRQFAEAEEALRESRKRYQDLVESLSDWVWEVDGNAVYTYVSPKVRDLLGYEPEEVIGKTPFDLMPPAEARRVKEIFGPFAERHEPFHSLENVNRHKDGHLVVIETSGAPFFGKDGTFRGYRGVDREIGERKRVEAALRRNEERLRLVQKYEALGRLAGGLAHHLNNMMTVVNGYSDLLLKRTAGDDPRRRDIERIRDAGERAAGLTREMLAFGRRQLLKPRVVDINDFLGQLTGTLSDLAGSAVRLSFFPGEDAGRVYLDPEPLRQSVSRLVANARDAMPGGGELLLATAPVDLRGTLDGVEVTPGPYVLLTLRDTGSGMDAEARANIFEPFYTTKTGSEGMGLPSVYGYIKQSGGYIFVDSALGRGTTFRLYLPSVEVGTEPRSAPAAPAPRRGKVLVVTDEPLVRGLLREILTHGGFEVLVAGNDLEAHAAAEGNRGAIVLLLADLDMAGGRAGDFVRRLAHISPGTRVLLLSSCPEEETSAEEFARRGYEVVRKPFQPDGLLARLTRILAAPPPGPG